MALEKPSYRDNLERIKEVYPNKEMLNVKNVATFCGLNRKTVLELFGFNKGTSAVLYSHDASDRPYIRQVSYTQSQSAVFRPVQI